MFLPEMYRRLNLVEQKYLYLEFAFRYAYGISTYVLLDQPEGKIEKITTGNELVCLHDLSRNL